MTEMPNQREHCSWVHERTPETTEKAIDLVRMAVAKVAKDEPLTTKDIPITKTATVIGVVGNLEVKIRRRAKSLDEDKCNGCGLCLEKCPVKGIPNEFDEGTGTRCAIYRPFPQAVPNKPVIDREHCRMFTGGKCGVCAKVCPTGAIDYAQEDHILT